MYRSGGQVSTHRAALDTVIDAIHIVDRNLVVTWVNDAYISLLKRLGLDEDVVGKGVREASPFLPQVIFDEYERALAGEFVITTERTLLPDGSSVETETHKVPIVTDGQVVAVVTTIRDLTEWRRVEAEWLEANRRLSEYSHIASHDLRRPLRTAIQSIEVLRSRFRLMSDDEIEGNLDAVAGVLDTGRRLINDLLEYAELRNHRAEFESVDLDDVVADVVSSVSTEGVEVVHDAEMPAVCGDRTLVLHIFMNLVDNAIKFNESNPRVVSISTHEEGCMILVDVSDNGVGIPDSQMARIFEPFERFGEGAGTGVGLSVVKQSMEKLGGSVDVTSQEGVGTTFHLRFRRVADECSA